MFSKPKAFFSKSENDTLLNIVRENESSTSGEIRIFIESTCTYVDPIVRAQELFLFYKMYETAHRNAVLIYIAYQDHDFAIIGDREIFAKSPSDFWKTESKKLARAFHDKQYVEGLSTCIHSVGGLLQQYFPYKGEGKNELPDEIIFGKK